MMGKDFGYVLDVTADITTGTITSIIVPGTKNRFLSFFSKSDITIPWCNIICIGEDLILVKI